MSELFERAVEVVLKHEGSVFTAHSSDDGGGTKFGISSRFNPDIDVPNLTREQAIAIYRERYWRGRRYENLPEPIAIKLFDLAVNMGAKRAVGCLQWALRACGWPVIVDGVIGPRTLAAVAEANPEALLAALRSEAAGEYRREALTEPDDLVFLSGWLARAYS